MLRRRTAKLAVGVAFSFVILGLCPSPSWAAERLVNPARFDPYKTFRFRVVWDGRNVAGVSKVSPLTRRTDVVKHRAGGDPSTSHKSPGRTEYDAVTLERGVTQDKTFQDWAGVTSTLSASPGAETALAS